MDAATRRLAPNAPNLLARLPDDGCFVHELQRCVVEVNSEVFTDLAGLHQDLVRHREVLVTTAADVGLAVAAAGTMPLAVPDQLDVTETPRYRRMLADYQLLAREQLICGSQVHVDVPDRDEAVRAAVRVAPYLPLFLALSASSPFSHDGADTGYASSRTLVWSRWPTSGPSAVVGDAAEYDALIEGLVRSGVITDVGMVYFDVRPSAHNPTLELRVCDSCPSVDVVVLIAGLFRALVEREIGELRAGRPGPAVNPTMVRAGLWQAARSGLEGPLVDVVRAEPSSAAALLDRFVTALRPQLEDAGDWELVQSLTEAALFAGSSAFRQRQALRQRGRLSDVVDLLVAETAGLGVAASPARQSAPRSLLHGYRRPPQQSDGFHDEAVTDDGDLRPGYGQLMDVFYEFGPMELRVRQHDAERRAGVEGATFKASGSERASVFPIDILPRIITAEDWAALVPGIEQRALALNHFIDDVYGARQIIRDGVVPSVVLDRAPGFRQSGFSQPAGAVRNHITGLDLVRTGSGRWLVMEDNLRVPSGVGYATLARDVTLESFPELTPPAELLDPSPSLDMVHETLLAAAPVGAGDEVRVALVSGGSDDSAWFEHRLIAERTGMALVDTSELQVEDRVLYRHGRDGRRRIDVLYVRMDEDMLLTSTGHDGAPLRGGLLGAVEAGHLTIANCLGNGVGDDKAVYAYVPTMIGYYLGERPLLPQIPTFLCAERDQRDVVLERLSEMVVKPIDGFGGEGITIGPEADERALEQRRRELHHNPERYIAQEVVPLSTHPTFDGTGFYPHHVDLRAFVHLRVAEARVTAHVAPACLSRVARRGTLVVNSSQGGGGKDTWILAPTEGTR